MKTAGNEELTKADNENGQLEPRNVHGSQDEDPCEIQFQDDHVIAELAGDLKKDLVIGSVVEKLQEASTVQLESCGFCDIIVIMALHDSSMYEYPKEPEDPRVGLYLTIAIAATIFRNYLKMSWLSDSSQVS